MATRDFVIMDPSELQGEGLRISERTHFKLQQFGKQWDPSQNVKDLGGDVRE